MARQIVQQPDGKYAVWSTIVDDFVGVDFESAEQIVEFYLQDAREAIERSVNLSLTMIKEAGSSTKLFEECLQTSALNHDEPTEMMKRHAYYHYKGGQQKDEA